MKKVIALILLITLANCGFKPLLSIAESNFSINKIEYNDKLGRAINNNLKQFIKKEGRNHNYSIKIKASESKEIALKDKKGNPTSFRQTVTVYLSVFENNKLMLEKTFIEKFNYNNSSKKFELSKFEAEIKKRMLDKISEEIIISLYSIQ